MVTIPAMELGKILESYVSKLIKSTSLAPYLIDNYIFKGLKRPHQVDHVIVLPNKVVTIEDKLKTYEDYKIQTNGDFIRRSDHKIHFRGHSVVEQVLGVKKELEIILGRCSKQGYREFLVTDIEDFTPSMVVVKTKINNVESVCCAYADKVTTLQTEVPIFTHETIIHYLRSLEAELSSYDENTKVTLIEAKMEMLRKAELVQEDLDTYFSNRGILSDSCKTVAVDLQTFSKIVKDLI